MGSKQMVSISFMVLLSSHNPPSLLVFLSSFFSRFGFGSLLAKGCPTRPRIRGYNFHSFYWHKKLNIDGIPLRTISDCLVL